MGRRDDRRAVTLRTRKRTAEMFTVFRTELEALRPAYSSPYATFLGMAFGILVAVVVSLLTTESSEARPFFLATALAFAVLSAFFLVLVIRDFRRADRLIVNITWPTRRRAAGRH